MIILLGVRPSEDSHVRLGGESRSAPQTISVEKHSSSFQSHHYVNGVVVALSSSGATLGGLGLPSAFRPVLENKDYVTATSDFGMSVHSLESEETSCRKGNIGRRSIF